MIEKGKPIPDWTLKDHQGRTLRLSDFRQKSHVVMLYEPQSSRQKVERWLSAIQSDHTQWDWLGATLVVAREAPAEVAPGVYVADRCGTFLNYFAPGLWTFDEVERELLYYEAAHC